jgi:hypothetical protein
MNASDPGERTTRLEREVLEILERADTPPSPVENMQDTVRKQRASVSARLSLGAHQRWFPRNWPQDLLRLAASLVLAIAAAIISETFRFGGLVLAIASAITFFSLWVQPRSSSLGGPTRWRGRNLDDRNDPPNFDPGRLLQWRGPKRPPQ